LSLFSLLFPGDRKFSSYDECPQLYYRFNGKGNYGPQKLDAVLGYMSNRKDMIECRFADEEKWRPLSYFIGLWNRIPPSNHSRTRLRNEGAEVDEGISEARARDLLRDRQKQKPVTSTQKKKLQEAGLNTEEVMDREQATAKLRNVRQAQQRRAEDDRLAAERVAEKDKMPEALERLTSLAEKVHMLIPAWKPLQLLGLEALEEQIRLVDEGLDYAFAFTGEGLNSDVFTDPTRDNIGYYLDFKGAVNPDELREFRARIFEGYLKNGSDGFDHLGILKKSFSNLMVSNL
jgi:hypothetical protein